MVSHSKMGMTIMRPNLHTPQHALNKAFRKVKPSRGDLETLEVQLYTPLEQVNTNESKELYGAIQIAKNQKDVHF